MVGPECHTVTLSNVANGQRLDSFVINFALMRNIITLLIFFVKLGEHSDLLIQFPGVKMWN